MDIKKGIKQLDTDKKSELLTGTGFWLSTERKEIGLGQFRMSDGPNGMRVQLKKGSHLGLGGSEIATCFPSLSTISCSWDEELCADMGSAIAAEAASLGVSVLLGPGLNVKRSPLCGRNFEYFSEDSYLAGKLAAGYVRGVQSRKVSACIKHFAVNSRELSRMVYDARLDEQTLREVYLTGFEIAVKEGEAGCVMTAYNKVNGVYCHENEHLISGILRGEWRFDGLVISDWGGGRNPVASIKAGADLEMPQCSFAPKRIADAIKTGELDERLADNSVERIYRQFEKSELIEKANVDFESQSEFARKCAAESLVLLKNENVLPFAAGTRVAVIGDFAAKPRYQGAGSSQVRPYKVYSLLDALKESGLETVGYCRGFKRGGKKSKGLIKSALKLAKKAEAVILCLGLDETSEEEGVDRKTINLPENQRILATELLAAGIKTAVVLSCGSVVDVSCLEKAGALIYAGLGGQSGALAVADALTGKINPCGRLSESFIKNASDAPCSEVYSGSVYKTDAAEGIYVGYKYYSSFGVGVNYPFGYGLSYTEFAYNNFSADENGVRVTVTNTGDRDGADVLQVYIKLPRALEVCPRELKAFKKVFLAAGEEREVYLPFDEYAFRIWNTDKNCWQMGGEYEIILGKNCRDLLFNKKVVVGKEKAEAVGYLYADGESGEKESYENYFNLRISADEQPKKPEKGMVCDYETLACELKYCKGFMAKLFGFGIKLAMVFGSSIVKGMLAHLPVKSLMQYLNFNSAQAEGFLVACNGKFFKGLGKIIRKK